MSTDADYILIASMDVAPEAEATFHEVYDREHVPFLSAVPGVLSVERFEALNFRMAIGGEQLEIPMGSSPRWTALYGLKRPEVLVSREWAQAVESGRWPSDVRPYTANRRHVLMRKLNKDR